MVTACQTQRLGNPQAAGIEQGYHRLIAGRHPFCAGLLAHPFQHRCRIVRLKRSGQFALKLRRAGLQHRCRIAAMPVKQTLSPVLIEGLVRLADVLVILGVGGLIFALYVAGVVDYTLPYQVTVPLVAVGALGTADAVVNAIIAVIVGALGVAAIFVWRHGR